ncbi:hypothetical protein LTR12_015219 [Friedmanniomyces endolithicus]|nr:hypothetical protein LTR12_015219 [Friedmanniomyces endolithicus]
MYVGPRAGSRQLVHIRVYPKAAELNPSNKASKPEESHFFTFGRLRREVPRFTSSDYPSVKLRTTPITILLGKPRIAYLSFLDDVRQRSAPAHGQLDTATSFLNPFPPRNFAVSVANDREERRTDDNLLIHFQNSNADDERLLSIKFNQAHHGQDGALSSSLAGTANVLSSPDAVSSLIPNTAAQLALRTTTHNDSLRQFATTVATKPAPLESVREQQSASKQRFPQATVVAEIPPFQLLALWPESYAANVRIAVVQWSIISQSTSARAQRCAKATVLSPARDGVRCSRCTCGIGAAQQPTSRAARQSGTRDTAGIGGSRGVPDSRATEFRQRASFRGSACGEIDQAGGSAAAAEVESKH